MYFNTNKNPIIRKIIIKKESEQESEIVQHKRREEEYKKRERADFKNEQYYSLLYKFMEGFLKFLFGPIVEFFKYLRKTYAGYKSENKLPIFFLTLSGIITLIIGFGFILKYSFDNFLEIRSKIIAGFIFSFAILAIGMRLFKKNYKEYASSLIGLSVILNYILIYFMATYYDLVSVSLGFIMIIANTFLSVILTFKYEA